MCISARPNCTKKREEKRREEEKRKEVKQKEKKRKEKNKQGYAFRGQSNEKPSVVLGCSGVLAVCLADCAGGRVE